MEKFTSGKQVDLSMKEFMDTGKDQNIFLGMHFVNMAFLKIGRAHV